MPGHFDLLRRAQTAIYTLTHARTAGRRLFGSKRPLRQVVMLQRASRSASASPSPIPFLMTQRRSATRSGSTPLLSSASKSYSPLHRTPASRHGNLSPHYPSRRPAPVHQFLPFRERCMNRWTAMPVIHHQTLVPTRISLSDSLAHKPLVHTSSRCDHQDQPAIPAEAPQRDTMDNKLVSLTAVQPPPAGCEKSSPHGHRNHPRHSRRACRRSVWSHTAWKRSIAARW